MAETSTPGLFKLWCLVGQDLHLIKLIVPRVFYVNQRVAKNESESNGVWRKVNKTLPRSHPSHYLYEYSVPEEIFKEHSNELMADLSTPDIEGIYETQVPLDFRAIVQLGCVCVVEKSMVRKETDTFEINQLKFKTVAQYAYLPEYSLQYAYIYQHKSGNKCMFGVFIPSSTKAYVFVVDTVRSNQMPNMNSLYNNERTTKLHRDDGIKVPDADFSFEIKFETDLRQVHRQIQRILQSYREEKRGPSFLAIQSLYDFPTLISYMPGLSDFPMVPVHVTDVDTLYNVLDWQRVGAKTMIRHFLGLPPLLDTTFELARYFHVPVGNIPRDTTAFGADLFYARHLQKHNTVLWCSTSMRPDLGGHEDDDNRLVAELEESNLVTEINNPGAYSTVCLELDIDALAVNTLLQAPHINEMEGTSSSIAFDAVPQSSLQDMIGGAESALTSYDETARCAHAFRILRQMVAGWLREVSLYQNVFADFQIVHFFRWLRDPVSLLYDPALRKILNIHMQKLFLHLISEFKRLGSTVVFANFNKIVICTKKRKIEDGIAYVQYIVDSIRNKELFHSIDISFSQCWEYFLWLDLANNGGVKGRLPDRTSLSKTTSIDSGDDFEENAEIETELSSTVNEGPVIEMNWNLADYLQEWCGCQSNFNAVIASYINAIFDKTQEVGHLHAPGNTPIKLRQSTQLSQSQSSQSHSIEEQQDEKVMFAQKLIAGELCQKLFFITQKIHKKGVKRDSDEMNEEEGNYDIHSFICSSSKTNPALQFVKSVCKVLSLDQSVSEQVTKLRRDLLKLLGIGEFSPEAAWSDPCVSFLLPEVICRACNHCRNIDLCKDPHQKIENGLRVWFCSSCNTNYCTKEIEHMLINLLQTRSMAYVLQDLQCERCSQANMTSCCPCGGSFRTLLKREEFREKVKIFLIIAKIYQLPHLRESVEWVIRMNPWIKI